MKLANGIVSFEFDEGTGNLVQITDLRSGLEYLDEPANGRLFRLFIPDEVNWIDQFTDSHMNGRPEMILAGNTLKINYPNLHSETGRPLGVAASVSVSLPAGDDEAVFCLELENQGDLMVYEAIFPWVGGWMGYAGEKGVVQCGTHWPIDPFKDLRRNDGWNIINSTRRMTIGFPHVNIPMCDISNGLVGLSFNYYPEQQDLNFDLYLADLNESYGEVHPSFGWVHRPFIDSSQRWRSGKVGIAPHKGGWETAAKKYRSWINSWWKAPRKVRSLEGAIGIYNTYFRDFMGKEWRSVDTMPRIAKYGLEHGLRHFLVWDMPILGMYISAGSENLFSDSPARKAEYKKALQTVKDLGICVSPLTNMRLTRQSHPFWQEHGEAWAIRSKYGIPAQETLPLRRNSAALINRYLDQGGARLCQHHPEFQQWALRNTQEIHDMGFNAIFIDQPFSEDYCFSEGHGHRLGEPGHSGVCSWIPKAAEMVHGWGPDSYLIGEVPDIWNTQFMDLWWFWDWSWLKPEVFRTILPDSLQSWVIDPFDHQDQVGKAFAWGFLLNINVRSLEKTLEDAPDFADWVAKLAALRQKTHSFSTAGKFTDQTFFGLDSDADITVGLYETDEDFGVVLGDGSKNPDRDGRLKLVLDPEMVSSLLCDEISVFHLDGEVESLKLSESSSGVVIETELDHRDAAVIKISKLHREM